VCADWHPARWAEYDKHFPERGMTWDELVRRTGEGDEIACYHPKFTPQVIKNMEMSYKQGHFLYRKGSGGNLIDVYFLPYTAVIGASQGEETNVVLVFRAQEGSVHGYPISEDELEKHKRRARQKGNNNV